MKQYDIGEMVSPEDINEISDYLESLPLVSDFRDRIWNGLYSELAYAYIHPHDDMRKTKNFDIIQSAFINAYV
jgi:hypothetical protein